MLLSICDRATAYQPFAQSEDRSGDGPRLSMDAEMTYRPAFRLCKVIEGLVHLPTSSFSAVYIYVSLHPTNCSIITSLQSQNTNWQDQQSQYSQYEPEQDVSSLRRCYTGGGKECEGVS